jgi:protein-tyrosine phosphatase
MAEFYCKKIGSVIMKEKKNFGRSVLAGALAFLMLGSMSGCKTGPAEIPVNPTVAVAEGVALPQFDTEVLLCTDEAKQVYDGQMNIETAVVSGIPYEPFVFEYLLEQDSGTLRVSEDGSFSDAWEYNLDKEKTSVMIDNLKTGTTYHYQVEVAGQTHSGTFQTAKSNRFISIPGTENLRDIGGYQTLDGKTVMQGLLIRGCELDGIKNEDYYLPDEDVAAVQTTFGFVHDLDLRSAEIVEGDIPSRLGADVGHKFYDAPSYAQIFQSEYQESLRQIFADLADPKNYPMYLHCTWGRDRTGTVVLLLQGLLGVSEEDLLAEYRLTGYVTSSVATNNKMDTVFLRLGGYEGDTLQEKIIDFLTTDIGVTEEEIQSIQSIFLG